jgi:hypothetical protein
MTNLMTGFLSRTEVWVVALAGAAFLALYWALRGAPIGQAAEDEGEEAPRAAYRDRVIAAMVVGLLLIVAGGYIALTRGVPWSIPAFAAGFGTVLSLVAFNQRYRHASPALRRTIEFSNLALTAALVAGILIVVNVLAFRYGGRAVDFTRERAFSLSSRTLKQLATLDRPVTLTRFFGDSARAQLQSERVEQLLELYRAANPRRVRLATINPFKDFEKYEPIVKRIPEVAVTQSGGILIEYGEGDDSRHAVLRNSDLFDISRPRLEESSAALESNFHGEDAVTSALIGLREAKKPKVVFTTGHGEPSITTVDPRRPGLGVWKARLEAMGSDVSEINLLKDDVPDDALLVVVGPATPFKPDEVARLKSYLDQGRPALVLLGNQVKSGLEEVLKSYNVEFGSGLIVDRRLSLRNRAQLVFVPVGGSLRHPIIDSLSSRYVLMPSSAPLRALGMAGSAGSNTKVIASPLLRTSDQSWAETEPTNQPVGFTSGKDEKGPLTVGVAVADRPRPGEGPTEGKPRLVVLSSSMMGDNYVLEAEPTNQDLLVNAMSWLRGRSDVQGISPKTHVALTLTAEPALRYRLIMVPTVMAVVLIIGLGVTTYLARRE